ncbi:alpha/beta hydrolase fold domain-containing protein [Streptomyces sp. NPDC018057]|uniref:alpha/beta hydrolase fold domain-containing protein n=1 Tax=unclassified Streptomyces TaxID=2593676 RepID=UPI003795978D
MPPPSPVVGEDGVRRFDSLTYAAIPGYRPCLLDVAVPDTDRPAPVVVWIHGGAWLFGDRRFPPPTVTPELVFDGILRAGLALVRIDYRHSREAPFPAQLHDAKAAVRYIRHFADTLGIDPDRIGAWGESAGGHLVSLLGLTPADEPDHPLEGSSGVTGPSSAVQAVVDWYGVTDLASLLSTLHRVALPGTPHVPDPAETLLGPRSELWPVLARAASPLTYADHPAPPFLIQHGLADREVPHHHSEKLAKALKAAGSEVVVLHSVADADHCFLDVDDVSPLVREAIDFLAQHLA